MYADHLPPEFAQRDLLILSHDYATFTKDQVEVLSTRFRHVTVLVRCNAIIDAANFIPAFQPYSRDFKIDLSDLPNNIKVVPIPLLYLPTDSGYKKLGEKHYQAVEDIIRKLDIKFDLIHAHFVWSAGFVGMRLKANTGVPLVITAHHYDINALPLLDDAWRDAICSVLNAADTIITVSKRNVMNLNQMDITTPIALIQNGFRSDMFYPLDTVECRTLLGLPVDRPILVTVGHLVEQKGYEYLIAAMEQLVKSHHDLLCVIVGIGKLKKMILKQVQQYGLIDNVFLAGAKPHQEIPLWINAADLFVLPSISEGNPTVLVECLACGVPFIGTAVGGIPEMIESGKLGFVVEPANPGALAHAIDVSLTQLFDPDFIVSTAQTYEWNNLAESIMDVYRRVI